MAADVQRLNYIVGPNGKPTQCTLCDKPCRDWGSFARHCSVIHPDIVEPALRKCPACNSFFKGALGLKQHQGRNNAPEACRAQAAAGQGANGGAAGGGQGGQNDGPRQDQDEDEDNEDMDVPAPVLLSVFRQSLDNIHQAWTEPFHAIHLGFMEHMHPDSEHCYVATLANNLLPGIIRFIQTVRLAGRPVDFLRRIYAIPEADKRAEQVIKEAKGMYKRMLKGDFPRRPPTDGYVSALVRKIISLGKAARLSAATQLTDLLHEALRAEEEGRAPGVGPSATLTPAQVQGYVQQFFPAARSDELDMMMNLAGTGPLDIEEEAPGIELTCDMVLEGIKRLHADSAPGPSGWTNNAIKFVASFCRTDAERTRLGEAYARCFNAVWSGRMPASVRFAWTDTRVVFIPKASGGVRPLGLRECLYRLNARIVVRLKAPQIGMDFARNQLAIGVPGGCEIGAQLAQHLCWSPRRMKSSAGTISS